MTPLGPGLCGLDEEDKLALALWDDRLGIPVELDDVRDVPEQEFQTLTTLGQVGKEPPPEWYGRDLTAPSWYEPDTMYEEAINGGLSLIINPHDDPRVEMIDAVDEALKSLMPRERRAVELWIGFDLELGRCSLGRVAEIMQTNVAEVRSLISVSLRKLRHPLAALGGADAA